MYIKEIHGVLLVQTLNYHRDVLVSRHQKEKQGYQGHHDFCTSLHQVSQLSGKNRLQMMMSWVWNGCSETNSAPEVWTMEYFCQILGRLKRGETTSGGKFNNCPTIFKLLRLKLWWCKYPISSSQCHKPKRDAKDVSMHAALAAALSELSSKVKQNMITSLGNSTFFALLPADLGKGCVKHTAASWPQGVTRH